MEQSATLSKLAQALCRFQQKCHAVETDSTVKVTTPEGLHYSFKYAGYAKIVAAIRPMLTECNLAFSQLAEPDGSVTTLLLHESGEYLKSTLLIPPVQQKPQHIGSAISYARRYGLSAILGLATDDDDDDARNNSAVKEKKTTAFPPDSRPWLTEAHLKETLQLIAAGNKAAFDATVKNYRIRRTFLAQMQDALKNKPQ